MGPLNIIAPQQELVLNIAQKIAKEKHVQLIVVQNEISKGVKDYIERHYLAHFLAMNLEVALKAFETLLPCNKQEVLKT